LATQIFDQTAHLHRLGKRERLLLEFSATVHDVGAFINVRNRHKHSLHILSSIDLPGLDAEEAAIVAQIARYHRRSEPKSSHRDYQAMSRHNRVVIGQLAGILRLAYALDVERVQRIRQVRCEVDRGTLLIHCDRRQVDLERWSIAGKSRLFSDVFGLKVALISRQEN
jgi:exopolyphosphatase/guanosine-5'-triphosphate,3'-diphosphate pyrophosphatase